MIANITSIEIKDCVIDEAHVRTKVDNTVNLSSTKDTWQNDTVLLASFMNNLEAGNVNNAGIKIVKFAIKRRRIDELTSTTIAYVDYQPNTPVDYYDYTQSKDQLIYSIVPIGDSGLEGSPNDVQIDSDFTGWFIIDKDSNEILSFDKFIGNESSVDTNLNQGRVVLETLSKYPQVYYTPQEYHTFQLTATFTPSEFEVSGTIYEGILNKFIRSHKPFLIKGSTGEVYVCDISSPKKSSPMNTWRGRDFFQLTIDCVEIMSIAEYFASNE